MTAIIDRLVESMRSAAVYNPDVKVAPACILWPDRDRQWESIIPRLQNELPEHKARQRILELEREHRDRRKLVWAEMGESQMALVLKHLARMAESTNNPIVAGTIEDICAMYCNFGWKVDDAVLKALSCIDNKDNREAVFVAIRSVYLPWMEQSARYFQKVTDQSFYPGGTCQNQKTVKYKKGECVLFVDGLRFDTAKRLMGSLSQKGYTIEEKPVWSALPSVTATCKPAVSPVKGLIAGDEVNTDFEPIVASTGQSLKGGYHFKKLLHENNWIILDKSEFGNGKGFAWCEFGDIDHLFLSGWKTVRVVTDHGWLLVPGGLPKTDLATALVENKWGRCAIVKEGAATDEQTYPWYWNPNKHIALADGVACYKKGEEYAHGGLSLQEYLTLELIKTPGQSPKMKTKVEITDVAWKGLRCKVAVEGEIADLILDIRTQPGDPSISVVIKPIPSRIMALDRLSLITRILKEPKPLFC